MFTRMRQASAAVLLAITVLVAPACGARIDPNLTPQQQEQVQLRDLQRVAQVVERVGNLVVALQQAEIALHRSGRIPQGTHESIQTYLQLSAQFVIDELEGAKDTTKTPLERRHGVMRALKFVDGLQTGIIDKIPDEDVRGRLGLFVLSIQTVLVTLSMVM
jgi:hypothetical protein